MQRYRAFADILLPVFAGDDKTDKPEAGEEVMSSAYEEIKAAADAMDCDRLESIFDEMNEYSIPEKERMLYDKLKSAFDRFDYEEIVSLLAK